jgi:1-acyl-sn-glycerol-3-phosphate acyltransferase
MTSSSSSLYPTRPTDCRVAVSPDLNLSLYDRLVVYSSSLTFIGSIFWTPALIRWVYGRWKAIPRDQTKRRATYAGILVALISIGIVGPHRRENVGRMIRVRDWKLWKSWLNYFAYEVIYDSPSTLDNNKERSFDWKTDQAILAIIPHGIFPFALAFAALSQKALDAFGKFRPVVASATKFVPIVRSFITWIHGVDASRHHVEDALLKGDRIGLSPGGIAEMFVSQKSTSSTDEEEYAILNSRKGFIRLAIKHGVPVVPIYCFGGSKLLNQLQLPSIFERISIFMRVSVCLFFGKFGLPIPFRQRLLYVVGQPIYPLSDSKDGGTFEDGKDIDAQVDEMHRKLCTSLINLFDKYKEYYGWGNKKLQIL